MPKFTHKEVPFLSVDQEEICSFGTLFTHHSSISEPGYVGYLPIGKAIKWVIYDELPCSLLKESTFRAYIYGKRMPWLLNTVLQFGTADVGNQKNSAILCDNPSGTMTFKDSNGQPMTFHVMGLGVLPIVINHIPLLIQCLIVEDLFPALAPHTCQLDAIIHRNIFKESGLFFHSSPTYGFYLTGNPTNLRLYREDDGIELLRINIAGWCEMDRETKVHVGSIGVYFGKDSCFNLAKPLTDDCLKGKCAKWMAEKASIAAAILGVQATLRIRHVHGWRFGRVKILTDSDYLICGIRNDMPTLTDQGYIYSKTPTHINRDLWEGLAYIIGEAKRIQVHVDFCHVPASSNVGAVDLSQLGSQPAQGSYTTVQVKPDNGAALQRLLKERVTKEPFHDMWISHARHGWLGVPKGFKVTWRSSKKDAEAKEYF